MKNTYFPEEAGYNLFDMLFARSRDLLFAYRVVFVDGYKIGDLPSKSKCGVASGT
jgi:hypothetical protein